MSEIIALLVGNIWPVIIGVLGLLTGGVVWKVKRANTKAAEATDRAEEAERQVQEAQSVAAATERAHKAIRTSRAKDAPKPTKKTPGAFETDR